MSKKHEQTIESTTSTESKPEPKLSVKAGQKYRGARLAWYERMVELEGKTRDEVTKNLEADPPALYGPKSKNAGKAEPVAGWVRFFERTGVATFQ